MTGTADFALPVAGLLAAGFGGGVLAGMLGLGGGMVINPLLMAMGLPPRFASASTAAAIVSNSAAASVYNAVDHRLDWKLGLSMGCGAAIGGLTGSLTIGGLANPQVLDQLIRFGFLLFLALAARRVLHWKPDQQASGTRSPWLERGPFRISSPLANAQISVILPTLLAAGISFIGSFLGIGGAVLLTPLLMQLTGAGIRQVIPVVQLSVLVGALAAGSGHIVFNGNLRPELCLWLVLGGSLGAPLGVAVKGRIPDSLLRVLYAGVISIAFLKIAHGLLMEGTQSSTPLTRVSYGEHSLLWIWLSSIGVALCWGPLSAWIVGLVKNKLPRIQNP